MMYIAVRQVGWTARLGAKYYAFKRVPVRHFFNSILKPIYVSGGLLTCSLALEERSLFRLIFFGAFAFFIDLFCIPNYFHLQRVNMGDALDDILNSALDEIEEDGGDGAGLDLQNAAKSAAGRSYEEQCAARSVQGGGCVLLGLVLEATKTQRWRWQNCFSSYKIPRSPKRSRRRFRLSSGDQASVDELAKSR